MAKILDGLEISNQIKREIKEEVSKYLNKGFRQPHLAAVLVGEDGPSSIYVNNKIKDCQSVGFKSSLIKLDEDVSEDKLIREIEILNQDNNLDGFIVQLPLPSHINQEKIIETIVPSKDVDGFHPLNFGKMALEMESFLPATPFGILTLLERYKIPTEGKRVVIIGRSRIVGKPMSILMGRKNYPGNATVILTHSGTLKLDTITKEADIIITALGSPNFLKANMVKDGVVIIDVGINRVENSSFKKGYILTGDVDFEEVKQKASWITPVPGGVGPMTRAMLLKNTMIAFKNKMK